MSLQLTAFAIFIAVLAMPAAAETWSNSDVKRSSPTWRSDARSQPRPHRTNGRNDCGNGDCRGANSPGILGGAPGDF